LFTISIGYKSTKFAVRMRKTKTAPEQVLFFLDNYYF